MRFEQIQRIQRRVHVGSERDRLLIAWVTALLSMAAAMCAGLLASGHRLEHPIATGLLAAFAIAAEREGIRISPAVEVTVASLVCIFAAVVFGPLSAVVVGASGLLADLPRRDVAQPILRWMTWTSIRVIVAGSAGLAATAVGGTTSVRFWGLFGAVIAAFAVETVVELVLTPVAAVIRGSGSWIEITRTVGSTPVASVPLQAPMVAMLAYSYSTISPWSVVLFAIPAFVAQRLHLLYRRQRETAEALVTANSRLENANLSFATALVATLDARDRYTAGHSAAVAIYARDIAIRMHLGDDEQRLAHLCGLVHDVGKIGLPAGLLEKPGALSLEERRQMEQHSIIGERILSNVDDYGDIAKIVRHHHERLDGLGYPDGLQGEGIPLISRVLAVADAYNAMTSDRPYRDAMPSRVARLRLAQGVEGQFDTSVVAAFEAILAGASEDYRLGRGPQFAFDAFESAVADASEASAPRARPVAAAAGAGLSS